MSVHIRPDFVGPAAGWCLDHDKHEGLRTPLAAMKQHMIDAHGFVYDDEQRVARKTAVRRTCPECDGTGWIGGPET